MNPSIAAASLLGFGDKPASEAMRSFSNTLNKMYETQVQSHRGEELSRKAVIDEYNKTQREKKRKKSDMMDALMGVGKKSTGTRKAKSEEDSGGNLLSKLLLGAGALLAGKALLDFITSEIYKTLENTITAMVEPIMEAFEEVFAPVKEFFENIGEKVTAPFKAALTGIRQFLGLEEGGEEEEEEESEDSSTDSDSESDTGDTGKVPPPPVSADPGFKKIYNVAREAGDPFPEVTAAQWALESGWGKKQSGKNNFFGQKAKPNEPGTWHETKEFRNGRMVTEMARFKDYPSEDAAIKERLDKWKYKYASAKTAKEAVKRLQITGGKNIPGSDKQSHGVYATDPNYVDKITDIISRQGIDPTKPRKLQKGGKVVTPDTSIVKLQKKEKQKKEKRSRDNGPKSEESVVPQGMEVQKRAKGGKIFLHWAGSGYSGASPLYHATIQGDGSVRQTRDYDQVGGGHTHLRNNQGIGISLAAMHGGSDGNFGSYPVKPQQYDGMAQLVADIATSRGWSAADINVRNVMTHAEAASGKDGQLPGNDNYGPQPWGGDGARWDLWMLYQNDPKGSGGGKIRNMIRAKMGGKTVSEGEGTEPRESDTAPANSSAGDDSSPARNTDIRPSTEGAVPGSPSVSTATTLEDALVQAATQLIAPAFGGLSALLGNPLSGGTEPGPAPAGSGATGRGNASGGAVSVTDPNGRAILNAIADAEGTSNYPEQGYRTMFTGKQFSGDWKHPRQIQSSSGYSSDAAGRYQFLSTTWDGMGMSDFSPSSQDQAALKLLSEAGVNLSDGLSEQEIYKVGQKWASVEGGPSGVKGGSYGSQAKYSATQFMKMYENYGGKQEKLQKGGTVGRQINNGSMKGSINTQMSRLREAQQNMKKKGGPKVIQVKMPPLPPQAPPQQQTGYLNEPRRHMTVSELSDYNRRLGIGALA